MHETKEGFICFGAIDSRLIDDVSTSWGHPHIIAYCGKDGTVYGDGSKSDLKKEGRKLKNNDIARVNVDLKKGQIEWMINNKTEFIY